MLILVFTKVSKVVNVTTVLTKYDPEMDAIVQNPHSGPNYYIFGGLVFQELSIDYVKTWEETG